MFDWQTEIAKQRQQEMLAATQSYQLVKEALAGACKKFSLYARTLAWLGSSLVNIGHWLQGRSGVEAAPRDNLVFLAGRGRSSNADSLKKAA